jgi:hypothetical protein
MIMLFEHENAKVCKAIIANVILPLCYSNFSNRFLNQLTKPDVDEVEPQMTMMTKPSIRSKLKFRLMIDAVR